MADYVMLVYKTHDSKNPNLIHYTGDEQGAVSHALDEHAFEVHIYECTRIHPNAKSVCAVIRAIMCNGTILED